MLSRRAKKEILKFLSFPDVTIICNDCHSRGFEDIKRRYPQTEQGPVSGERIPAV